MTENRETQKPIQGIQRLRNEQIIVYELFKCLPEFKLLSNTLKHVMQLRLR